MILTVLLLGSGAASYERDSHMAAEGAAACRSIAAFAEKHGVDMSIMFVVENASALRPIVGVIERV